MAEGRNIEIRLAATGGEAAAAEVKKVEAAAHSLAGGTGGTGLKALHEETGKVTKANVQMGTGMNNVGYQLQDLAVQIGSGTSTFRALGQQLPQLLSGFGPLGITLGTVAAVALPLAGALFSVGDAAESAGEKAGEAEDKLKKLTDARQGKAMAEAATAFKAYLQALDDEFDKITRNSNAVQRSIEILQAANRAKMEEQDSQAALDLAVIDASDKSEAEKIKARAEVNRRVAREKLEGANTESALRVESAKATASGAGDAAALAAGQVGRTGQDLASQQAEAEALRGKILAADAAKASLPGADLNIKQAEAAVERDQLRAEAGLPTASKEGVAAMQKDIDDAKAERDRLATAAGGASLADRQRLNTLQGVKQEDGSFKGGQIADTKKAVEDLAKAAADLASAAEKARLDAEKTSQTEARATGARNTVTQNRLKTLDVETGSKVAKAIQKDEEEARDKRDKADKKRARGTLDDKNQALDDTARGNGTNMRKRGKERGNKTMQDVGKALADGTDAAELQKLGDMVKEAQNKNGAALTAMMMQVINGLSTQAQAIEVLKKQIKNKP